MLKLIVPILLLTLKYTIKWNFILISMAIIIIVRFISLSPEPWTYPINSIVRFDLMSASLVILTMWITPLIIIASQKIIDKNNKPEQFLLLVNRLAIILVICFSINNIFNFYILFEASLIPTIIIVLTWGYQPERLQAGIYLMMYTITRSLPLLIAILYVNRLNIPLNMIILSSTHYSSSYIQWFIINTAFLVKLPIFIVHLWLPKAHVEAPVAGSIVLAAILLKLGGYGLLRMSTFISPLRKAPAHSIIALSIWGGLITSLICVRQPDMKSLIAYSSVGHMRLVIAGRISNRIVGSWGALTIIIAHGLVRSAMFANANFIYEATRSRNLLINKGLHIIFPSISILWFIMCAANIAAPPSINLLAEIILITATLSSFRIVIPIGLISYLAAVYSLILYTRINHGSRNITMSFFSTFKQTSLMCLILHLVPVIILIISPTLILTW